MNIQSITRILGLVCLFIAGIGRFSKAEAPFLQPYIPYLIVSSILLLGISLYYGTKTNGVNPNLKIRFVLLFVAVVVAMLILIYQLTKK